MPYKLAEYHGDTLAVPQLVVSHLTQTDGDTIRAALYLLQTGDTDPRTMARALGLSSVEAAKRALQYWAGAGLLVNDRGGAPIPEPEKPQKIDLANLNDPYVAVLCEEAQTAFGKALSRSEMQRLVGLYLTDGWQPDVILLCCAEVARQGRRTIAAVARELIRWREAADALTRWERSAIARWHEEWGIGREMIEEALLRARNKTTICYVDGILRAWRAQGITTVSAARGQGQLSGSNILATQRPAPQQPAAASAQQPLSSRDWMAMFDEEG